MFRPTKKEIAKIVKDHENWVIGKSKGKRAEFSNMDLGSRTLSFLDLSGADFVNCDLTNANFEDSRLDSCRFEKCLLKDATFEYADFRLVEGFDGSFLDALFDQTTVYETSIAKVFLCSYAQDAPEITLYKMNTVKSKMSYSLNIDDYFRLFGVTK